MLLIKSRRRFSTRNNDICRRGVCKFDQCCNYHLMQLFKKQVNKQNVDNREILIRLVVLSSGDMAKNKQKGKKTKSVFQVANKHLKHKNKTKPVTTTLKHVRTVFCCFYTCFFDALFVAATQNLCLHRSTR